MDEQHYFVVTDLGDGEFDYHVDHPESCLVHEEDWGGTPVRVYRCDVGSMLSEIGFDSLEGWEEKGPGRYPIHFWARHYPSTPDSGEEWDAGLEFIE